MISSTFPKSFRVALDLVVFYDFCSDFSGFSNFAKFTKHHQVTCTPKTLRNPAWNHLTVLWLNFEKKNRKVLFSTVQALSMIQEEFAKDLEYLLSSCSWDSCSIISSFEFTNTSQTFRRYYYFYNVTLVTVTRKWSMGTRSNKLCLLVSSAYWQSGLTTGCQKNFQFKTSDFYND